MIQGGDIGIFFQGRSIEKIELKEVYESGCLVNVSLSSKRDVDIKSSCDDDWLVVSPAEFTIKGSEIFHLSIRILSDAFHSHGVYRSKIHFFELIDGNTEEILSREVVAHHKKSASGKDGSGFSDELGDSQPTGVFQEFLCKGCGAPLPDKRPYCLSCRKKRAGEENKAISSGQEYRLSPRHLRQHTAAKRIGGNADLLLWGAVSAAFFLLVVVMALISMKRESLRREEYAHRTGSLSINTDPPGAVVIFGSNDMPERKTPLHISSVKGGNLKVKFQMSHCANADKWQDVVVKPDTRNEYFFNLEKVGELFVQSIPGGSAIFIDGKETGKLTPAMIEGISEGSHRITVSHPAEKKISRIYDVRIGWGESNRIFALLDDEKAGISISCADETKIYVDGALAGKTPRDPVILDPGPHKITLVKKNYVPWAQQFDFLNGEVAELQIELVPMGTLVLEGEKGATFYLDGQHKGALPGKLMIIPGKECAVKVVSVDGSTWEKKLILLPGQYRKERVTLTHRVEPDSQVSYVTAQEQHRAASSYEFLDFNLGERFSSREWKILETLYEDVDNDGKDEMIFAVEKLKKKGKANPIYLYVAKKGFSGYEVINLKEPSKEGIGEGELIHCCVYKTDDLGYREIEYLCADKRGKVASHGAFIIYKERIESYFWTPRSLN